MDQETVVVQVLAEDVTQNGHNSSSESGVPMDSASDSGDPELQNTKLVRKPLSPITKSYKEKKHQCKQCGAQFSKKLDMHIHRLTHSDTDEKSEAVVNQAEAGLDLTVPKVDEALKSEGGDEAQDVVNREVIIHNHQQEIDEDQLDENIKNLNSTSNNYQDMLSKILSDASQSKYHLDIIVPTPKRTYRCEPCNKRFSDYSLYLQHREDHPNPKLFKCSVCSKGFTIKGNLTRHQQIHKDVRLFECNFCRKKFSQKTHLVTHLEMHTKKPLSCKICLTPFQREHNLRTHVYHVHDQANDKEISSTPDEDRFSQQTNNSLEEYKSDDYVAQDVKALEIYSAIEGNTEMLSVETVSDTAPEKYYRNIHYTCGTCGVVFFDFQTYVTHKKEHPTPKLFACEQCGKSFTVKGNLQRHLQIHQDIRLHECDICHKKFSQKTHLAAHMHVHSKERPYVCTLCGGSFTREGNLRRHVKMHTGAKKEPGQQLDKALQIFKCDKCFKTFMRRGNLKRHQKLHTR